MSFILPEQLATNQCIFLSKSWAQITERALTSISSTHQNCCKTFRCCAPVLESTCRILFPPVLTLKHQHLGQRTLFKSQVRYIGLYRRNQVMSVKQGHLATPWSLGTLLQIPERCGYSLCLSPLVHMAWYGTAALQALLENAAGAWERMIEIGLSQRPQDERNQSRASTTYLFSSSMRELTEAVNTHLNTLRSLDHLSRITVLARVF